MLSYPEIADDYYINMNLHTEMALPTAREAVLSFFERIQKTYPTMRNFHTREGGDFVLEEEKEHAQQRWVSLEPRRLSSGCINPAHPDDAAHLHELTLQLCPYMLSVSPLDCEALDFTLGFDFTFRGNHDQLVADVLGVNSTFESLLSHPGSHPLGYEPTLTVSLDDKCRRQARLSIETRTSYDQVRRQEFTDEPITVYLTVRQYGSLDPGHGYEATFRELRQQGEEILHRHVIDQVLRPLQQAIDAR